MDAATAGAIGRPRLARLAPALAYVAGGTALLLLGVAIGAAHPSASPLSPDHAGGDRAWSALYLGAISASFVCYVLGLLALARRRAGLLPVVAVAAAIQLAPLAGPVLLSTDVYTYWARGRVGVAHDANPYVRPPSAFPGDPAFPRMGAAWRDATTGYGPAFTLVSEAQAAAGGSSAAAASWTYRGIAAASMLALVALAAAATPRRALAAAFVGWNPLLAVQFAGGGHSDALMMALVLGAIVLAQRGRRQWAGAAWALSIALKWIPLVFLPLRALEARRQGRPVGHLGFAAAAGVVIALASWRYGAEWLRAFPRLTDQLGRTTSMSLTHRLSELGLSEGTARALLLALFVVGYLWLLREAWRGRARLGLAAGMLLLQVSWLTPWYAVWAVPLAAIEEDRTARLLALALSAYLLRQAVPL